MEIEKYIPLLETILEEWREAMGSQYEPYKNHVYRVLNYCFSFYQCEGQQECTGEDNEKLVIAGCFHDLGIWSDDTFDYLAPSVELAKKYLAENGREEWSTEIERMIDQHHKFRRVSNSEYPLVEIFRKGDWVDASLGMRKFGLPRSYVRSVSQAFPNLGFHKNLMRLARVQWWRHPLNPLPMVKW